MTEIPLPPEVPTQDPDATEPSNPADPDEIETDEPEAPEESV